MRVGLVHFGARRIRRLAAFAPGRVGDTTSTIEICAGFPHHAARSFTTASATDTVFSGSVP